jgi:hypothetical protein
LDFRSLTTEFELAKNSKTKEENAFFFIFLSPYAEMSFFGPKKVKKSLNRVKKCFLQIDRYGNQEIPNFTLISKWDSSPLWLAQIGQQ